MTSAGDYVQTLRLAGSPFESADDETLNNYHERPRELRETVLASLARYEPEVLGVYLHGGRR